MSQQVVKDCEQAMEKRLKNFEGELTKVRTGRASITVLDRVRVDYYGSPTPINQVATLATPDARTITVAPFEKKSIAEIEKAIFKADLGLTPTNDGNIIRIPIPQLTEDRRKELVKGIKKIAEDAKVLIRQERRDANEICKKLEKEKQISEDDNKRLQADIQKVTDKYIKLIDDKVAIKEKEVMTV